MEEEAFVKGHSVGELAQKLIVGFEPDDYPGMLLKEVGRAIAQQFEQFDVFVDPLVNATGCPAEDAADVGDDHSIKLE